MPWTTPLATVEELAERCGEDDPDVPRAMACIEEASALVMAEAGSTAFATWNQTELVPDVVKAVVIAVASRTYRNPDGLVSQTVGGITETLPASSVTAYLTEYERGLIRRVAGKKTIAFVRTTRDDADITDPYVPVVGSSRPVRYIADRDRW